MTPLRSKLEQNIGWFILILLAVGCLIVMRPFVTALLWGAVLCFSTWPLYLRVLTLVGNRRTLAAMLMTLALVLVILLPFVIIGATLADQVGELTSAVRKWIEGGPPAPPEWLGKLPVVGERLAENWQSLATDKAKFTALMRRIIEPASARLLSLGVVVGAGLIHLAGSLLIAFFFFRNGASAAERLSAAVIRIGGDRAVHLLNLAGSTIRGVVYGVLGTALFQALMAGIGFLMAGVPGAGVLALVTLFFSLLPLGPPLVCLFPALWLHHQGATGWAIFMMIWGLAVGSIDNFLKPWLISRGSPTPFLLILFGVLGGAIAFGLVGVFLGPTLLALGYRILEDWLAQRSAAKNAQLVPSSAEEFHTIERNA